MKQIANRGLALLLAVLICFSLLTVAQPHAHASENWVKNWGVRGAAATELSDSAQTFYTGNYTYENLSQLSGGSSYDDAPDSALYAALQTLMAEKQTVVTSYNDTKVMYQYTDCQNGGGTISSFYSGVAIGPEWGSSPTWNREHTWPNSKGSGDAENDIMMLRPTASSENSSRGNTAYGESSGYFDPNGASSGNYDLRGDVARIMLYVYTRWGNTEFMWGSAGVIESQDVLLKWMEQDPVDTWELGRNDSVQSITGTRNVYVDYPELAFLLFGQAVPPSITTPSNGRAPGSHTCSYGAGVVTEPTCVALGYTTYTCTDPDCGYSFKAEYTNKVTHSFTDGICTVCGAAEAAGITLVTDVADLQVGDRIVIVAKNVDKALSVTQNKNNRATAAVTKTGNTVSFNDDTQIIVLEAGNKSGTYAFNVGNGYLYAASSSSNYLRTETTLSDNSSWTIEIDATGVATIKAQGSNARNWMRYNPNNALFAVYASGQDDILIYELPGCSHDWTDATCQAPKTCTVCGATEGEKAEHTYVNGICSVCGAEDPDAEPVPCEHDWTGATCTAPKTCSKCGEIEGEALGHSFADATCQAPKTCTVCGATEGEKAEHTYVDGTCSVCGAEDPNAGEPGVSTTAAVTFDDTAKRTVLTTDQQVWVENGVTVTNDKDASTSNVADYANPARFYKSSKLTITYPGMTKIEFVCNASKYVTALEDSLGDAEVTVNGMVVTVTFAEPVDTYAISLVGGQVRLNSLTVYTEASQPSCEHDWTGATCTAPKTCSKCGETEGEALGHSFADATCQAPKTCTVCGTTEGEKAEHSWTGATCTDPKTCSKCGETEGEALGHSFADATCQAPKTCTVCGATEGEKAEHTYVDGTCSVCGAEDPNYNPDPDPCVHDWTGATCTAPKTCSKCGETEGEALGHSFADATCQAPKTCTVCGTTEGEKAEHSWTGATCTTPKTCSKCGETEGDALGHSFADATCQAPKTCTVCGATEGEKAEHTYVDGTCSVCGAEDTNYNPDPNPDPDPDPCVHDWTDATCSTPKTCSKCGETEGDALGHSYTSYVSTKATCEDAGVRTYYCANGCGGRYTASISATGHNMVDGTCTTCGKTEPTDDPAKDCTGEDCVLHGFADLKADGWYHDGIHYGVEKGLFNGMSEGRFEPAAATTRAQFVVILWRLEGCPEVVGAEDFADVTADQWYTKAINWAASQGIVGGYGNGLFGTNDVITREQMATLLYRYAIYKDLDVTAGTSGNLADFADALQVQEYAAAAMQWACAQGLVRGIATGSDLQLAPAESATRAQAATVLYRYCEEVAK